MVVLKLLYLLAPNELLIIKKGIMKKILLATVIAVISVCIAQAQEVLDLSKGKMVGVTLMGKTLSGGSTGGRLYLPVKSYKDCSGLTVNLSNPQKKSGGICAIIIEYKKEGEVVSARNVFYGAGKKNLKFLAFKAGKEVHQIDPASVKNVVIETWKEKSVDLDVTLNK